MKIAILNVIKPHAGSGDGMTEYAYQLYTKLSKSNKVDLIYPLEQSKRNDIFGLVYTNSVFKLRLRNLAKEDYDIIHIVNQELGFAAKMLKRLGSKARIITSIHDLMRVKDEGYHRGMLQDAYSNLVSSSVHDALNFSDSIIFTASSVRNSTKKAFGSELKRHFVTLLCPKDDFRTAKIPSRDGGIMKVGYIGALAFRKNILFMLKTAKKLKENRDITFLIYGSGAEKPNLITFKEENKLSNVSFMGFAPEDKLMQIYDEFDLFMYPTVEEGSSLPILDAQARGLPAIVLKENNMDEEVTKYCFKAKDEGAAAKIILNLKSKGYDKKARVKSTEYARSFSWDRVAKETVAVYKKSA